VDILGEVTPAKPGLQVHAEVQTSGLENEQVALRAKWSVFFWGWTQCIGRGRSSGDVGALGCKKLFAQWCLENAER
jgi:hypothetical protein